MSTQTASTGLDAFHEKTKTQTGFIGHPWGLAWLSASEFWERFCYYGVQSLLVLYLIHYLLQPGHVEQVWGFETFRNFLTDVYRSVYTVFHGAQYAAAHTTPAAMQMALASNTAQLYAAFVYTTPLIGGYLADRVIGRTFTVALGATIMVVGTFLLAFNQTFLVALVLLLIGTGCFKANIAAQVGDLYKIDDPRRADGFYIYYLGIQLAVIPSPLICGWLGQSVDWHFGFLAAGVGMVCALAIYLAGRKNFPPEPRSQIEKQEARPPLTGRDWMVVGVLVALLVPFAVSITTNQEIFDAYLTWGEKNYQLTFFGVTFPTTTLVSFDAFISTGTMIGVIFFWRWYAKHWREPTEIAKIVVGVMISTLAPLVLVGASSYAAATGAKVTLVWALAFHLLNDIGFGMTLPMGLSLYSRAAPKGWGGTMIAVYYIQLFMGNLIVGPLGGLYGSMKDTSFWMLHVYLMAGAAVVLLLAKLAFGHLLAPSNDKPAAA